MAIYEGSKMRAQIDAETVFHEQSITVNGTRDFKEVASKDTDGKIKTPGTKDWTASSSAYVAGDEAGKKGVDAIFAAYDAGTLVTFLFTDGVTGNSAFSGSGYISDFSIKAENEDSVTFDYSITGSGVLTKVTNA